MVCAFLLRSQYFSRPTDLRACFFFGMHLIEVLIDLSNAAQGDKTMLILHSPYLGAGHQGGFQLPLITGVVLFCASV